MGGQGQRWPVFAADEIEAAAAVLRSGRVNYWTGEEGRRFEEELARWVGVRHAIALANGTVALELALWAMNIDAGEVIVPARTFVATASAVRMRGCVPVFADVDRESGCVTPETIAACITERTRAVVVVHLGGWPCEMGPIAALCRDRGIALVEDCAQSHGARWQGRMTGSFGAMSAFSFCQDKIMTTAGEGGMLVTDDEALWKRAWSYKDHGKVWDRVHATDHPPGFRWLHGNLGTNWRLSEVQSAVGRKQLEKLDGWVAHRRALAEIYRARLRDVPGLRVPEPAEGVEPSWYRVYAYVEPSRLKDGWSRDRVLQDAAARGLQVASGSCSEIYKEDAFPEAMRPAGGALPVARELGETSLALLVDPTVTRQDVEKNCAGLVALMAAAAG